jgi:hypothetical protein
MEVISLRPEPWTAKWFAALIHKARDNADELRHIDTFVARDRPELRRWSRWRLRRRIRRHLRTAKPEDPPQKRYANILFTTGAFKEPKTTVIFFKNTPPHLRDRRSNDSEEGPPQPGCE